jgi:nitroreductase/FMN reductase [NAD(P)H]
VDAARIDELLRERFGDAPPVAAELRNAPLALALAERSSSRRYTDRPVPIELVRSVVATAMCAPSKSDLQQADVVIATDPSLRAALAGTVPGQDWIPAAPVILVVCGNNRRQRQLHTWRGHPFANDHLDAFFNAAVDGGIVLATLLYTAEAAGLGACPISGLRDRPEEVSDLLGLPEHVFPVAGLGLGWPAFKPPRSPRLPLAVTVHENRWSEENVAAHIAAYDTRRGELQPYRRQREVERFGEAPDYGWSEDKVRQYATPQRPGFAAFVRGKGFKLD